MRIRHLLWLGSIALMTLLVGACGGEDATDSSLDVVATDFEFAPASYKIEANTEIPLTFTNDGSIEHEWVIMESPIEDEGEFAEDLVKWEEEAEPGESKTATIPALEPGTYQIICGIQGHFAAGMKAELEVVDS